MKAAPLTCTTFVTTLLLSVQISAAPADILPNVGSQQLEERGENGWLNGEKLAINTAPPADAPVGVLLGLVNGLSFGSKNGQVPRAGQTSASLQSAQPAPQSRPPAASTQATKTASLSVNTKQDSTVYCRRFPDTITSDGMGVRVFAGNAKVDLTCWTSATLEGPEGRVNQNGLWLKTNLGCYINDADINPLTKQIFRERLEQCPTQSHYVGTLQAQYKREDCYSCTSLDCPSQNLGRGPLIDLDCSSEGATVGGSNLWYKQVDRNCFYPSGVFVPTGFKGTKPQKCPQVAVSIAS